MRRILWAQAPLGQAATRQVPHRARPEERRWSRAKRRAQTPAVRLVGRLPSRANRSPVSASDHRQRAIPLAQRPRERRPTSSMGAPETALATGLVMPRLAGSEPRARGRDESDPVSGPAHMARRTNLNLSASMRPTPPGAASIVHPSELAVRIRALLHGESAERGNHLLGSFPAKHGANERNCAIRVERAARIAQLREPIRFPTSSRRLAWGSGPFGSTV